MRPGDLSITEGGMMEVCVEFTEGQIPAERVVMISVSETFSMSLLIIYCKGLLDLLCYALKDPLLIRSAFNIVRPILSLLSYYLILCNSFINKSTYHITLNLDQMDLKIGNNLLLIPPGDKRACFEIEAVDDTVIEDTEIVNITVLPFNLDDRVMDGVVSVTIVDNDGM